MKRNLAVDDPAHAAALVAGDSAPAVATEMLPPLLTLPPIDPEGGTQIRRTPIQDLDP